MKITLPQGFKMPEGSRPGEPFEVVATIAPSEDGSFSLAALDGMSLPEEGEMEEPEEMEEMGEEEEYEEGAPVNERTDSSKIVLPF
jgi:hypothetical protein